MTCFQGDLCDKTPGLPIVLARYAVTKKEANAPELSGSFKMSEDIDLGKDTRYTLRLLRPGYVYVYNPADESEPWRGYTVTPQGYLCPFSKPIGKDGPEKLPHSANGAKEPCKADTSGNGAVAQCITIPHAEKAGRVWIGFSEVEWTKDVWQCLNDDAGCRGKVMREFDVKAWLASGKAENAGRIAEMEGRIAEFVRGVEAKEFDFSYEPLHQRNWKMVDWSATADNVGAPRPSDPLFPTPQEASAIAVKGSTIFKQKCDARNAEIDEEIQALLKEIGNTQTDTRKEELGKESAQTEIAQKTQAKKELEELKKRNGVVYYGTWGVMVAKLDRLSAGSPKTKGKALVLALDDAPAITSDLVGLMFARTEDFNALFFSGKNHRLQVTAATILGLREQICSHAADMEMAEFERKRKAFIFNPYTDEEVAKGLSTAYEKAWKSYKDYYDEKKIEEFQKFHLDKLQDFSKANIIPLAKAHVAWMESRGMKDTMALYFDENDPYSGLIYSHVVSRCMGGTQEVGECLELYRKWMDGTASDKENFYLRALLCNQRAEINQVECYAKEVKGTTYEEQRADWEKQFKIAPKAIKELTKDALDKRNSVIARLLAQGAGVFFHALAKASEGEYMKTGKMPLWLAIASKIAKGPIPFVEVVALRRNNHLRFMGETLQLMADRLKVKEGVPSNFRIKTDYIMTNRSMPEVRNARVAYLKPDKPTNANISTRMFFPINLELYETELKKIANDFSGNMNLDARQAKAFKKATALENINWSKAAQQTAFNAVRDNSFYPIYAIYGIFQFAAFCAVKNDYEEYNKRDPQLKDDFYSTILTAKYTNWGIATASALFEFIGEGIERYTSTPLRYTGGFKNMSKATVSKAFGKVLGVVAAIVSAGIDFAGFDKAKEEGKKGLMIAYAVSGAIGGTTAGVMGYMTVVWFRFGAQTATLFGMSCASILFVLFVAAVLVYFWVDIEKKKANLQEWLARSIYGKKEKTKKAQYDDLAIETKALELVFK